MQRRVLNLTAWAPKSFLALRDYNGRKFGADLAAGVTVGLVALPLSMAFAIASGAPPEAGLYTAVVAGFAISALGGSRNQIGGPTGAFVVIIAGILAHYGFNGLLMCTIMAGCLLIVLGATGLGAAVKFIPRPVMRGLYQRHRHPHRQHPDQRLFRIAHRPGSRGFSGAHAGGAGECANGIPDHDRAFLRLTAADRGDDPLSAPNSRLHCGPARGYAGGLFSSSAGRRRLGRASGASLQAFPAFMCRSSNTPRSGR